MSYPLNTRAWAQFKEYRNDPDSRDSNGKKLKRFTKQAQNIAIKKMRQFPAHVQQGMVRRAIDNCWITVHLPRNTLDHDNNKFALQPDQIDPSMHKLLDSSVKSIPKPKNINKINQEREKIRDLLDSIPEPVSTKGTDRDEMLKRSIENIKHE